MRHANRPPAKGTTSHPPVPATGTSALARTTTCATCGSLLRLVLPTHRRAGYWRHDTTTTTKRRHPDGH
jgi:hypothetical protein